MNKFKSFRELSNSLGRNPKKKEKPEKEIKCRICGGTMNKVEGTNVYLCNGTIKKDNEEKLCKNFLLSHNK